MNEIEIWKPIKGFEGLYDVSSFGRIRSCARVILCNNRYVVSHKERILRQSYNRQNGYYSVSIGRNHYFRSFYVHRLVAGAFLLNPNNHNEVNHKDENKGNNRADNLEWCDRRHNLTYGSHNERCLETKRQRKVGIYPKYIAQYTLGGEFVALYPSSQEAARAIGKPNSGSCLRSCARGLVKQSQGYIWRYSDSPVDRL